MDCAKLRLLPVICPAKADCPKNIKFAKDMIPLPKPMKERAKQGCGEAERKQEETPEKKRRKMGRTFSLGFLCFTEKGFTNISLKERLATRVDLSGRRTERRRRHHAHHVDVIIALIPRVLPPCISLGPAALPDNRAVHWKARLAAEAAVQFFTRKGSYGQRPVTLLW